jgi:alpha-beta hydrolase superfamily lysophospholipase
VSTTGFRTTAHGVRLRTRRWEPAGAPRSAVVVVHGLAEHSGRYEHVGAGLAARGHDVRASDLRGFGESEGRRAWIGSWEEYLDDLEGDVVAAATLAAPVVLLGHSLGGLIAASYALSERPQPALLVLSAPSIDAAIPALKKLMVRILGRLAPMKELDNGLRGDQLSGDPTVGERYFADPLVYTRTTLGMGRLALQAQKEVRHELARLDRPTLVIHAAEDTIVPTAITARFALMPGVERVVFPGYRHETFNEDRGTTAIGTVADWIEARLGELPDQA